MILVFGSNTEGRHGKGMAKMALDNYGAIYGQARGLQGRSYAIITKDLKKGIRSVELSFIAQQVEEFKDFALATPMLEFYVGPIGCGLAGFKLEEIAPMFKDVPENVKICEVFKNFNEQQS